MAISNEKLLKGLRNPDKASYYLMTRLSGTFHKLRYARKQRFTCGSNFRVKNKFDISGPGRVLFGDDILVEGGPFNINTFYTYTNDAIISAGSHTYFNGVRIGCRTRIDIGSWCIFADARITDNDAHSVYPDRWDPSAAIQSKPVIIEDNVWVCLAAIILKGVRIGRNSVVGAGAVVSNDVPENSVVAGNPARVVKTFTEEEIAKGREFFLDRNDTLDI